MIYGGSRLEFTNEVLARQQALLDEANRDRLARAAGARTTRGVVAAWLRTIARATNHLARRIDDNQTQTASVLTPVAK